VALTADGQMLAGEPARRQAAANPEGVATGEADLRPPPLDRPGTE
jgi:molecular chaperone DnaK (HSP70)